MATKLTANKGASETRLRIQRKIKALRSKWSRFQFVDDVLEGLANWISHMDDRQNAKPGGLGRGATKPGAPKQKKRKAKDWL